jgi:ribosomal protein S18 acetylase RimI-like enzyme
MEITWRTEVKSGDIQRVKEIVESTKFFHDYEVEVAVELVIERLHEGDKSGYNFVFAEVDGVVAGYSCFGLIACTKSSHDLYWIVTHDDFRGKGIGKKLLEETYKEARKMGATSLYAETSAKEQYAPTRHFYDKNSFTLEARLKDFYDEGDDKLIYLIKL